MILLGTKSDARTQANNNNLLVTMEQAQTTAKKYKCLGYVEVSTHLYDGALDHASWQQWNQLLIRAVNR